MMKGLKKKLYLPKIGQFILKYGAYIYIGLIILPFILVTTIIQTNRIDFALILLSFVVPWFLSSAVLLLWIYIDAERRGETGAKWAFLLFFGNIFVILVWLIYRPPIQYEHEYTISREDQHSVNILKGKYDKCPKCGEEYLEIEIDNSAICHKCGFASMDYERPEEEK